MLKFKFLLWMLGKMLNRVIQRKPACASYVAGKEIIFQIRTKDGVGRYYTVSHGRITSTAGTTDKAAFAMTFSDPGAGFKTLSAKNSQGAFLSALQDKTLSLSGDFVEIMWFQGLTDFLKPKANEPIASEI